MKSSAVGLSILPLLASASPIFGVQTIHNDAAPVLSSVAADVIPDSYMVVFKPHVTHEHAEAHQGWVQDMHSSRELERTELRKRSLVDYGSEAYHGLKHSFNVASSVRGYSGHFDDHVIEQIRRHPDVEYIERDSIVHVLEGDGLIENNAPWGLARISHRERLGFGSFNKYLYAEDGGEGVDVYVVDTGTYVDHVDFEGRAKWGKTIPVGDTDTDANGHGTHCSGTIAGKKYGVSKNAHVIAVKVLGSNGSGSMSDVVKGIEFVAEEHEKSVKAAKKGKRKGFKGSAANMSLGGGKSTLLDRAVNAAVDAGVHFAVAAGNDNADSCNYSPASAEKAVTVGASAMDDSRAWFSNYGTCNDIFAPGLNVLSTWIGSPYAINIISGTSMASPHIAGLLAYMLSLQPSKDSAYAVADISPKRLKADLLSIATIDALTDVPSDTANVLAWNGGGKSNYTEIIADGAFNSARRPFLYEVKHEFDSNVEKIKDSMTEEYHRVHAHSVEISEDVEEFIEGLTSKLEDFIVEEIQNFEELRN